MESVLTKGEADTSSLFPAVFRVCLWRSLLLPVSEPRAPGGRAGMGLPGGRQVREAPQGGS